MSHLDYTSYEGFGQWNKTNTWYNQCVRIGDQIQISGQGGWDRETGAVIPDLAEQIEQAFRNVEHTLQSAGGSGWEQVYQVRTYHAPMTDEAAAILIKCLKKYCPNHQPILTVLGISKLALEGMAIEIEVTAHVPASA